MSANVVQMHASHDSLATSSEEADMRLLRPRGAAHRERDIERVAAPNLRWASVGEWFCAFVGGRWTRLPLFLFRLVIYARLLCYSAQW